MFGINLPPPWWLWGLQATTDVMTDRSRRAERSDVMHATHTLRLVMLRPAPSVWAGTDSSAPGGREVRCHAGSIANGFVGLNAVESSIRREGREQSGVFCKDGTNERLQNSCQTLTLPPNP